MRQIVTRKIEGKHHVPIYVKGKEKKPHIRWIELSASFAAGVAIGYWIWNKRYGAYFKHPIVKALKSGDLGITEQLDIIKRYELE